jgi:hypothetical protein
MSTDGNASVEEGERFPGDPAAALTPGVWSWRGQVQDRLFLRLHFVPGAKIEVGIWWNRDGGHADVQLIFGLYPGSIELGSLKGNGFNAPGFHRAGFGTVAVNIAVQALQAVCPSKMLVEGVLSTTDEIGLPAQECERLEANRRAFWRRFGLDVVRHGSPELDYLYGHVSDLHTVTTGEVAGQFARCIPLDQFERVWPKSANLRSAEALSQGGVAAPPEESVDADLAETPRRATRQSRMAN